MAESANHVAAGSGELIGTSHSDECALRRSVEKYCREWRNPQLLTFKANKREEIDGWHHTERSNKSGCYAFFR
ncbi:MAG: hypothetical protein ACREEL_08470 [Stellaceae bacterium]